MVWPVLIQAALGALQAKQQSDDQARANSTARRLGEAPQQVGSSSGGGNMLGGALTKMLSQKPAKPAPAAIPAAQPTGPVPNVDLKEPQLGQSSPYGGLGGFGNFNLQDEDKLQTPQGW